MIFRSGWEELWFWDLSKPRALSVWASWEFQCFSFLDVLWGWFVFPCILIFGMFLKYSQYSDFVCPRMVISIYTSFLSMIFHVISYKYGNKKRNSILLLPNIFIKIGYWDVWSNTKDENRQLIFFLRIYSLRYKSWYENW